jgi:signal transduction histidine kinase
MLGEIERAFAERLAAEERLRRFVAEASHELRTPVTSIRGYAEVFRRGAGERPADLAKVMRRIEEEGKRMGELVEEILPLNQGLPPEREPLDVAAVVDAAVDAGAERASLLADEQTRERRPDWRFMVPSKLASSFLPGRDGTLAENDSPFLLSRSRGGSCDESHRAPARSGPRRRARPQPATRARRPRPRS